MPHVRLSVRGPNKTGDPDFLHVALTNGTCAAFSKESRMKFANATKLHRKSGRSPQKFSCEIEQQKQSKHIIFNPRTLWRTWGTRPVPTGFC